MASGRLQIVRSLIPLLLLCIVILSPIWSVERFIVQDASGHVNTSFVMSELLKGNTFFAEFYQFNSIFVPNSSGHWLMVLLLQIFSPFVVTKIMMSLTFIALPVSAVWLRRQVVGDNGSVTTFLIGCAVAFNWFWLLGTFNFLLGLAVCVFTLGLYWRWRDSMNTARCCLIVLMIAFVYFSHLIGFMILSGSIIFIGLFAKKHARPKRVIWILPFILVTVVLLVLYKISISGGGGEDFYPVWRSIDDPNSVRSWINQLIAVDPFVLISRRTLPFTDMDSTILAVFSPFLWVCSAVVLFSLRTLYVGRYRQIFSSERLAFLLLSFGLMTLALFGPDDFNLTNGGLLRQRLFLASLLFMIPLFDLKKLGVSEFMAHCCLIFVLIFQTVAMWEFALRTNEETRDFVEAASTILDEQKVASIVIVKDKVRFHAQPTTQMLNYLGNNRNLIVVDNYEMGHNLFPVITRDDEMRKFILGFTNSNILYEKDPREDFAGDLKDLNFYLSTNSGRVEVMLLYGRSEAVEGVLAKSFDSQPFYTTDNVRLFQRRK